MTDTPKFPVTLVKDGATRVANTPADLVTHKFNGYRVAADVLNEDGLSYADLQGMAKELGVAANGSHAELQARVEAELEEVDDVDPGEADDDVSDFDVDGFENEGGDAR